MRLESESKMALIKNWWLERFAGFWLHGAGRARARTWDGMEKNRGVMRFLPCRPWQRQTVALLSLPLYIAVNVPFVTSPAHWFLVISRVRVSVRLREEGDYVKRAGDM
jgi:hypothetical protein